MVWMADEKSGVYVDLNLSTFFKFKFGDGIEHLCIVTKCKTNCLEFEMWDKTIHGPGHYKFDNHSQSPKLKNIIHIFSNLTYGQMKRLYPEEFI